MAILSPSFITLGIFIDASVFVGSPSLYLFSEVSILPSGVLLLCPRSLSKLILADFTGGATTTLGVVWLLVPFGFGAPCSSLTVVLIATLEPGVTGTLMPGTSNLPLTIGTTTLGLFLS